MTERISLNVDGKRVSLLRGRERKIFYIHSSGSDAEQWRYQLEEIGGYAIDLPNHGKSESAEIGSVDDYARYVSKAIRQTCGSAVIAGHSLGGAVAQKVCLNYPETCIGLVLVGTGARLRVLPEILENLRKKPEDAVKKILEMGFFRKDERYEEMKKKYIQNAEVLHLDLSLCDRFDLLEDYRSGKMEIGVPTLIVVGREDRLTPVKYAEFFKNHIPGSELAVIDNASHMVMLERPDEFNSVLESFLRKVLSE
mgnify:CR=1 FL=1